MSVAEGICPVAIGDRYTERGTDNRDTGIYSGIEPHLVSIGHAWWRAEVLPTTEKTGGSGLQTSDIFGVTDV